jgi:hypothetical protein
MKLDQLITQYINYRKSLGEKFKTNEVYLKAFCKLVEPGPVLRTSPFAAT